MATYTRGIDAEVIALRRIADSIQDRSTKPHEATILRQIASRLDARNRTVEELGFSMPGWAFIPSIDDPYTVV